MLDIGHRFRPACDHHTCRSGGHLPGGVEHGLQAGAAPSIDLQAGDPDAQAGVQRCDTADGRGLTVGIAVAQNDIIDVTFVQAGTVDQRAQSHGRQIGSSQRRQSPAHPADRSSDGIADHDIHASTVGLCADILKYLNQNL